VNATVTPQVESFVDAMLADQHDDAVRRVFAGYLEAECGFTDAQVRQLGCPFRPRQREGGADELRGAVAGG
jgi:hypothetical protein